MAYTYLVRGLFCAVLAACYAPKASPGAPCADNGACPSGLACAPDNTCELPGGPTPDAGGDATLADAPTDGAPATFMFRRRLTIKNVSNQAMPAGSTIVVGLGAA